MRQLPVPAPASLARVLADLAEHLQRASGADIVSIYLYDAASQTYYAPIAIGLPEEHLVGSIADMQDQLARYLADAAQGKAPVELDLKHYGPNVWLTVTRQTLYASDAPHAIDSSFIRRYHVQSVVGLPLIAGDTLVGLLYLNFCAPPAPAAPAPPPLEADHLAVLEHEATQAALTIERARQADERAAVAVTRTLAAQVAAPAIDGAAEGQGLRQRLPQVLAQLLSATGFEAAAVYQLGGQRGRLELLSAYGLPGAPAVLDLPQEPEPQVVPAAPGDPAGNEAIRRTLTATGLHLAATFPLRLAEHLQGWLFLLSQDPLAWLRRAPATSLVLHTAADLLASALASQRLIATLEETNRVLGALSRMNSAVLQPGASRQAVLDAVVRHLTDAQVPEFDFQFATVFLLDEAAGPPDQPSSAVVRMTAGAATTDRIDATPVEADPPADRARARVPRWVQLPNRSLAPDDVLVYVATHWQLVVVGAVPDAGQDEGAALVVGSVPDHLHQRTIPAIRDDGTISALVPALVIGQVSAAAGGAGHEPPPTPFTLAGDVFDASGHRDLVRVFVPFGLAVQGRATGVLEAGYHRSHPRRLHHGQLEALRACAAQIAVAVETARLYEESKRHAEHLEITTDVSKALAASIDLDQTLRLVARNLARLIDASLCQIALYEEDGSAWHGAAASDEEALWRRQRGERPAASFLFDVLDRHAPLVIEDAQTSDLVPAHYARLFGIRSLLALPLVAEDQPIGAVVLAQRDRPRTFTAEEVQRTTGLAHQAAIAIKNARRHAFAEEERHIQKDVVLVGFGQWGQKAYQHLLTLKQFFNFKTHVVHPERGGRREQMARQVQEVLARGDAFYWDTPEAPARAQLRRELESSCYVITYIATPAATHLPVLTQYYDLSNVVVIEKPLGASPEAYRQFLDSVEGGVELVAADHYCFKLEVQLLQLLLTEERTLKAFIDSMDTIELELLEAQPLTGAAAEIGIIADMMPHAFAILSLFTPIDRIQIAPEVASLAIGRQEPLQGDQATYARLTTTFPHQGRPVRLIIDIGKGVETAKWIKLSGEARLGGRRSFYKFDFVKGEAIDGTQTNLRAAVRTIREPGIPDNAHLTMLRHVMEKRHPAVGILAIREALRSNQRIQDLQTLASDLLARGEWTPYSQGQRPAFPEPQPLHWLGAARSRERTADQIG